MELSPYPAGLELPPHPDFSDDIELAPYPADFELAPYPDLAAGDRTSSGREPLVLE